MADVVLINLGRGNLHEGFPLVTLQIRIEQRSQNVQFTGSLPPDPKLLNLYHRWQLLYNLLYKVRSIGLRQAPDGSPVDDNDGIYIEEADVTNVSETEFTQVCIELQQQIDSWLDSKGFRSLERQLRMRLNPSQDNRIILQTEDDYVKKLPWYIWQFFQDYSHTEIALSPLSFAAPIGQHNFLEKIRVLAILGDATGIDIDTDRRYLESLENTEICFLDEPTRSEFDRYLWDSKGWDVLFFAGHSATQESDQTGRIFLNTSESLTIQQLQNALKKSIERGLHLAIFNSCEGLGLATQLAELNIPEIIVMRELVPDQVAQAFLKNFLSIFSTGQSLYLSVREAREQLQGLESDYPGASWLPVMFQNPAIEPIIWRASKSIRTISTSLSRENIRSVNEGISSRLWQNLVPIFKNGLLVTSLVMGSRWLGLVQPLELLALDTLMKLRPSEVMDERLLIVTIDESDKEYQKQAGMALQGSLADQALAGVIETLAPHSPAVIGLDIYRDYQDQQVIDPEARAKTFQLRDSSFIDICQVGGGVGNPGEIAPPSEAPIENVGFSDLTFDPDLVVRRQIFGMSPGSKCATERSFSFLIAQKYLQDQGVDFQRLSSDLFQIGTARFQNITSHSGGYHRLEPGGFTVLLNYRNARPIATEISLQNLLDGSVEDRLSDLVSGKIVLIGNIDTGDKDYHQTPNRYLTNKTFEMPGVIIHAHMVSHLISATLDARPALWWWPQWGDMLWILGWSILGGGTAVVSTHIHVRYLMLAVTAGSIVLLLIMSCFISLWLWGGWLPVLPTVFGILATATAVKILPKS
ncbi:MAG: CHASE2 domain-containing protein [Symploca sp. SIO2G7]|nr:CHASE2 domain-containing protein [Symploca sp. SIO2G7]